MLPGAESEHGCAMTESGQHQPSTQRGDWWSRRPRRSRTDSKIAGVAGGLGHYLGVDPILFRVGFVAFTLLGGAGVLAYCLLWLLLPAEGDEVSAGESLIGRGRSSVSPILAVGLAIVVLISVTSSLSFGFWRLPFWPLAIVALIALHIARKQRRGPFRPGSEWSERMRSTQQSFTSNQWPSGQQQSQGWSGPRGGWGGQHGRGGWGNWGGCGPQGHSQPAEQGAQQPASAAGFNGTDDAPSPFDTPAFWENGSSTPGGPATAQGSPPVDLTKGNPSGGANPGPFPTTGSTPGPFPTTGPTTSGSVDTASAQNGFPAARTTPPAWDPLGAAPFAWDLPDIELAPQSSQTLVKPRKASPVIARATMGTAFLTVAIQIVGMIAGWWVMTWAAIGGTALAIVAVGLLVQALRGRSITLVGPGILLSLATVGLALTGLAGTASVGQQNWTQTAAVNSEYHLSAGDGHLDLTRLTVPAGDKITISVDVNAGQATVKLPPQVTSDGAPQPLNLDVKCTSNAGQIDCLGNPADGLNNKQTFTTTPNTEFGTLELNVHVGTGDLVVTR